MSNKNELIKAIENKSFVNFSYDGKPIRKAAPHALYLSSAGNENLDAFQYDGYSKTGNLPDWRNFTLSKIRDLLILDEFFQIAKGYNRNSAKYDNSIRRV